MTRTTRAKGPVVRLEAEPQRLFETDYGYFTADGAEYVITRPDTPKPWVNIICPGDYGLAVSQAGSGYSWKTHASLNRITRWEQDLVTDQWGKYLYLRDEDSGAYWSATWKPVCPHFDRYECRHGLGYSRISSVFDRIQTDLTLFVPPDAPLEIWILQVTNLGSRARNLSLWSYLEWCLGTAPDSHREFHKTFIETRFEPDHRTWLAHKRLWAIDNDQGQHWNRSWEATAWHSANQQMEAASGSKEAFIGQYGSVAAPGALLAGQYLQATTGRWDDAIASFCLPLALPPDQSRTVVFTLGAAESQDRAMELVEQYQSLDQAELALETTRKFWQRQIEDAWVWTPEQAVDVLTNRWLKYQTLSARLWGRTAYYQPAGGYGFRDQLQDSQLWLHLAPQRTREQILLHASHQYPAGHVHHWWHPITNEGLESGYSDDLLWLPYVTTAYIKETGDQSLLTEPAPYLGANGSRPAGSLYDHCCRAIELALSRRSERVIPHVAHTRHAADVGHPGEFVGEGFDEDAEGLLVLGGPGCPIGRIQLADRRRREVSDRADPHIGDVGEFSILLGDCRFDGRWAACEALGDLSGELPVDRTGRLEQLEELFEDPVVVHGVSASEFGRALAEHDRNRDGLTVPKGDELDRVADPIQAYRQDQVVLGEDLLLTDLDDDITLLQASCAC